MTTIKCRSCSVILLLGLALTLYLVYETSHILLESEKTLFSQDATSITNQLRSNLLSVERAVNGTASYINLSPQIYADDFRLLVQPFVELPFISLLSYIKRVSITDQAAFEVLQEERFGLSGFTIHNKSMDSPIDSTMDSINSSTYDSKESSLHIALDKKYLFPIVWFEPRNTDNLNNLGKDISSCQQINKKIDEAVKSGKTLLIASHSNICNKHEIIVIKPLYSGRKKIEKESERHKLLKGLIKVDLPISRLLNFDGLSSVEVELKFMSGAAIQRWNKDPINSEVSPWFFSQLEDNKSLTGVFNNELTITIRRTLLWSQEKTLMLLLSLIIGLLLTFFIYRYNYNHFKHLHILQKHKTDLLERQRDLHAIFANIPNVIVIKDAKTLSYVQFNKAAEKILGMKKSDVLGKSDQELYSDVVAKRYIEDDKKALLSDELIDIPEMHIDTIYGQRFLHTQKLVMKDRHGNPKYLMSISEDISLQKEKEKLQVDKEHAELANISKSNFLANMSHELRTPMHGILSYSNIGIKRIENSTTETNLKYFSNIKLSATRLMVLLDDLLDLAKLESGKMVAKYSDSSLKRVAENCILEQNFQLEENQQKVVFMPHSIEGIGTFDEQRISQVITNLLSNAIKYSPANTRIYFSITESLLDNIAFIKKGMATPAFLFSVRDSGEGVPEEDHDRIFDKLVHNPETVISAKQGTGLGLPISKEIIELHHGTIGLENSKDGGAIFSFTIPQTHLDLKK